MGLIGRADAGGDEHDGYEGQSQVKNDTLAGRTFFIRGRYLFVNAAVLPPEVLKTGDTFLNW